MITRQKMKMLAFLEMSVMTDPMWGNIVVVPAEQGEAWLEYRAQFKAWYRENCESQDLACREDIPRMPHGCHILHTPFKPMQTIQLPDYEY